MLIAKLVFLVEGTKSFETMAIIANVEQIESGTHPNSLRYKILKDYNDLSEKKIKEIKFYINSGFFSSGTLYINDKSICRLTVTFNWQLCYRNDLFKSSKVQWL